VTLALDERRAAMLREMGIRLLPAWGGAPVEAVPVLEEEAPPPTPAARVEAPSTPVTPVSTPVAAPVRARTQGDPPAGVPSMDWAELEAAVAGCRACGLCEARRNTVFGVGPRQADWMVIGEAPGETEEQQGEPFSGQAGRLLDNMLRALGLDRGNNVYIANVLKCRPPGNRNPEPEEIARCEPFLRRQVELVRPRMIVAMGRFAVQALLQTQEPVGKLRGRVHRYHGVPLVVTYHPAYLLRNLPDKSKAWADLCLAAATLEAG
jgi:DNA polymerase